MDYTLALKQKIQQFGKKKLIDGVTREDIELYQEVTRAMELLGEEQTSEKISKNDDDDLELFVRMVQKK